ncbi:MAG: type I glyceraldehyde-3-phosphate dehydrogenase [Thermoguttaceae bacterium]|nr:type I glyceraldehyde-3-phosphate dehydrogenase [Thermoguttaceae bacterium]
MAAVNVGINGFGRIGRIVFRQMMKAPEKYNVVGINDLTDTKTLAILLKYDSSQGRFDGTVEYDEKNLIVNGKKIPVSAEKQPSLIPWAEFGADVVLESTGFFTNPAADGKEGYDSHNARKVVISAPAKGAGDEFFTCVLGVNDDQLKPEHKYVSNASCTTNCLAPVAKVLNDNFGIVKGLMTTVHSYTNDQVTLDKPYKNIYRGRAAGVNIIPTTTGAAKAVGLVIPEVNGKLTGISLRVPTPTGSIVDLVCETAKPVTVEAVNAAVKAAAASEQMKGVLDYCEDPIVLADVVGQTYSSIFVPEWTMVIGDNMVKILSWYDNEMGYSTRAADLIYKLGNM